jgi:hypothetical protein
MRLGKVQLRRASGHEPQYNEPGGYLFGEKPLPPGQKRVKEDWENIWIYVYNRGLQEKPKDA